MANDIDLNKIYTEGQILAWFKDDVDSYNRPKKLITKVKYLLQFLPTTEAMPSNGE